MNSLHSKRQKRSTARRGNVRKHQRGSTLIEILVSILIFSFGLVGLVGLQAKAMQISNSAEDTSRASLLANELATTMITSQTIVPSSSVISAWEAKITDVANGGLPNGTGATSVSGNVVTITVQWQPPATTGSSFNATNQYVTQVVLP